MSDGLTDTQRQAICAVFAHYPQIVQARLYGSRALERYHQGSDIDLTLFGEIDLLLLNKISLDLDDLLLPYAIDLSVYDHIQNTQLRQHIDRAGVDFYQKS